MTALDLINFRRRFRFTQAECARAIGCSPRSISAWELGQNTIPDSIALACSAVCFGLPAYASTFEIEINGIPTPFVFTGNETLKYEARIKLPAFSFKPYGENVEVEL